MLHKITAFIILGLFQTCYAKSSLGISAYTINVKDLQYDDVLYRELNPVGPLVAKGTRRIQNFTDQCIDMATLESRFSGSSENTIASAKLRLLSKSDLDPQTLEERLIETCDKEFNQYTPTTKCDITVTKVYAPLSSLLIGTREINFTTGLYRYNTVKIDRLPPMMSWACVTGRYSDYWLDSAPSMEAKKYLKEIGLDITQTLKTFQIFKQEDGEIKPFFRFGFIQEHQ